MATSKKAPIKARRASVKDMRRARMAYDRATLRARVAERVYARELSALAARIADVYQDFLAKAVDKLAARGDATPKGATGNVKADLAKLRASLTKEIAPAVELSFGKMYNACDAASKQYAQVTGIPIKSLGSDAEASYTKALEWNVSLVEDANREYAEGVRDIFTDPDNFGRRPEELSAMLQAHGDVSESRANLIARDQTLKTLGAITQARHEAVGITSYTWSTSLDGSVRESHAELEGQVFSYDDPPEPGNPGEDFQCRCAAIPVVDEAAGLFGDDASAPTAEDGTSE